MMMNAPPNISHLLYFPYTALTNIQRTALLDQLQEQRLLLASQPQIAEGEAAFLFAESPSRVGPHLRTWRQWRKDKIDEHIVMANGTSKKEEKRIADKKKSYQFVRSGLGHPPGVKEIKERLQDEAGVRVEEQ